ncbi:MAG: NAD-dependent epimerase/dehydratase family protein, partial [Firmicutes bacterium]|nr:NAD-dependent epimerase/dehydratase family protein [Bacillota bacterium]
SFLKEYLKKNGFDVKCVGVRGEISDDIFKNADTVIHTAGIVHNKKADESLYKSVNVDLTEKLAFLAKESGVKHFVFFSTMSVYGLIEGEISKNTPTAPKNGYGKSKLLAEEKLFAMESPDFKITVIRPPMVYGKGCPGNYAVLSKTVKTFGLIPDTDNKRSMIYIGNLAQCVEDIVKNRISGIICPQNAEYVNTAKMCGYIAKYSGKKVIFSKTLGLFVSKLRINAVKKAFGSLYYSKDIAYLCDAVGFEESIAMAEDL